PLVLPAHPRTLKRLTEFGLLDDARAIDGLILIEAVGYLAFLRLVSGAALAMTDSGGVQQESCILKIPCITLRERTEWVETVELGANEIAGTEPEGIAAAARRMLDAPREWEQPFGDGRTGEHNVDAVVAAGGGEPVPA